MALPRIFVSHSHADNTWCIQLGDALTLSGFDVSYDKQDLRAGAQWIPTLETEIESCDVFLAVLTPDAWGSHWVRREFDLALHRSKHILGVLHKRTELTGFITTLQTIEAVGQDARHVARIVGATLRMDHSARPTTGEGSPPPIAPRTDGMYYGSKVTPRGDTFVECLRFFSDGHGELRTMLLAEIQGARDLASRLQAWSAGTTQRYAYALLNGRLVFAYPPEGGPDDDSYLGLFVEGPGLLICDMLDHTRGQVARRLFEFLPVDFTGDM
jgi:hypothetical protein